VSCGLQVLIMLMTRSLATRKGCVGRASEIKAPNAKTFLRADALNNGSRLGSAIPKPFCEGIVLTGAWWNALASRRRVLTRCTLHAGIQAGGDFGVF
jgi:hypothetical protein